MNITLDPARLTGTVTPPPSKSQAHRALIAAALAGGVSTLSNLGESQDIAATLAGLQALGAGVERVDETTLRIHGLGPSIPQAGAFPCLDCGESGSTLRFLIPVALAVTGGKGRFTGRGRLMERPQEPYFRLFEEKGISYGRREGVLTVEGTLRPGVYALPGDVSSQFFTGLLLALPLLHGDSELRVTTPLQSRDYVEMTLHVLRAFGIDIEKKPDGSFCVPGGQRYQSRDFTVEGDWSQGAFWYAANFLDNQVTLQGLCPESLQGDRQVALLYWKLARPGDVELDVSQCPDLVPPLAVMAAVRAGTTRLVNAARLRMKESDRLTSVASTLNALGAQVEEHPEHLVIHGVPALTGGVTVDSWNDHRIAMMAAIAATKCSAPVTITGAECVNKSYPTFWEEYKMLGGKPHGLIPG